MQVWSSKIEFAYRVFVRSVGLTARRNDAIKNALEKSKSAKQGNILYHDSPENYWPITLSRVDEYKKKGFFVSEVEGKPCLVVSELLITVLVGPIEKSEDALLAGSTEAAHDVLDDILNCFGKGEPVFAGIRIISEKLTELHAL